MNCSCQGSDAGFFVWPKNKLWKDCWITEMTKIRKSFGINYKYKNIFRSSWLRWKKWVTTAHTSFLTSWNPDITYKRGSVAYCFPPRNIDRFGEVVNNVCNFTPVKQGSIWRLLFEVVECVLVASQHKILFPRPGVPNMGPRGTFAYPKGKLLWLATEGKKKLIYYLSYIYQWILFSKIIICFLLNIPMISHDEIFCHK